MGTENEKLRITEETLRLATEQSLASHMTANAIFLAERLYLMFPSNESSHLLSTALLRDGKYSQAAAVLQPPTSSENRYLYAVCCLKIGTAQSLKEAEKHLRASQSSPDSTPGGASGLYLLGSLCQRTGRRDEAIDFYRSALKANPTLWVAFEALSSMGMGPNGVDVAFGTDDDASVLDMLKAQSGPQAQSVEQTTPRRRLRSLNSALRSATSSQAPPKYQSHGSASSQKTSGGPFSSAGLLKTPHASLFSEENHNDTYLTPSPMPSIRQRATDFMDDTVNLAGHAPAKNNAAGARKNVRIMSSPCDFDALTSAQRTENDVSAKLFATPPVQASQSQLTISETPTPATRKRVSLRDSVRNVGTSDGARDRKKAGNDRFGAGGQKGNRAKEGGGGAMDVIRRLARIRAALDKFQCHMVLSLSDALPQVHRDSSFVLSMRGRAYLEQGDYAAAEVEYQRALGVNPQCLSDIAQYYSTVLWHTKNEVALSYLAICAQREYPVTSSAWCAAGNCFSLQRDADTALRYFKRATVVDPLSAYAHTLCGHEYVVKEDFEAALMSYRKALQIDDRHYNALYGIGQVLQKQEKYEHAERHFRTALRIHPRNATLHYHLGVAIAAKVTSNAAISINEHHLRNELLEALTSFETAANLDPRNPVVKFERAKLLVKLNEMEDAKLQLESLASSMPKEAEVHYELCRVSRHAGDRRTALRSINTALDLDPKDRRYKKELEALNNSFPQN